MDSLLWQPDKSKQTLWSWKSADVFELTLATTKFSMMRSTLEACCRWRASSMTANDALASSPLRTINSISWGLIEHKVMKSKFTRSRPTHGGDLDNHKRSGSTIYLFPHIAAWVCWYRWCRWCLVHSCKKDYISSTSKSKFSMSIPHWPQTLKQFYSSLK